jgi:putative addiction module component (TIGR02574 family)
MHILVRCGTVLVEEFSMSPSSQQLLNNALELPTADRGRLAALLIDSLEGDADADAESAWDEEIHRRLTEIDSGSATLIPWSEARERIRGGDDAATG